MKKLLFIHLLLICAMTVSAEENQEKIPPVRLKNRGFEIALIKTHVGFNNSFIAAKDIFKQTAVIDYGDLTNGFKTNAGVNIAPAAININWKDRWGFGLDMANISVFGNVEISKNLLQFQQSENDKFGVGASAFLDFGIPTFFHIRKLKVTLRPAVYLPIAYTEPGVIYTFTEKGNGFYAEAKYDMYIYSPIPLEGVEKGAIKYKEIPGAINTTTLGFDMNLGLEFPLLSWLDVGVNIQNIPLKPSTLKNYMQLTGKAFFDSSVIDLVDVINNHKLPPDAYGYPEEFKPVYGTGEKKIMRPFKFISYALYCPFESKILSLIPSVGLGISLIYANTVSVEAGIKFRLDLANMFVTTIGIGYEDQLWRNSVLFAINLKAIELDIGVSFESQDFVKSWQGAGAGIDIGLKLGW